MNHRRPSGFDFTKRISGGLEYYAAYGSLNGFDPLKDQEQQFLLPLTSTWDRNGNSTLG
jgi:hypothetical protein